MLSRPAMTIANCWGGGRGGREGGRGRSSMNDEVARRKERRVEKGGVVRGEGAVEPDPSFDAVQTGDDDGELLGEGGTDGGREGR